MKLTISLDDFWMDEDDQLEPALKKHIIQEVTANINSSIKSKVEEHIIRRVREEVEKKLYPTIDAAIATSLENGQIKSHDGREMQTIQEYVNSIFTTNQRWNSVTEQIKKMAENYADQMKARFDLTFASQLVVKMNQNGLLKKDVAKLLLDNK